ncbi:glycosyltransferase family 2 protein, partial [Hydrogenophaga sp.]|uniref:glycosyltransferase n=1 Tax=Hydrogenophaga sp. TaxID=1904254 RepID=UPI0016AA9B9C
MDDEMRFSVVLPVCHGGALLRQALESLRAMDYPRHAYEVIVAAAPGQPEAERLVDETCSGWPVRMRALRASRSGRSAQLNMACNAARGRVLAFTDDDCTPPPDWLRRIEQELARRPATAVLGGTDELSGTDGSFDV